MPKEPSEETLAAVRAAVEASGEDPGKYVIIDGCHPCEYRCRGVVVRAIRAQADLTAAYPAGCYRSPDITPLVPLTREEIAAYETDGAVTMYPLLPKEPEEDDDYKDYLAGWRETLDELREISEARQEVEPGVGG